MTPKTTMTPLHAQRVLNHWKMHGNQELVSTVERTLALAKMGGDPRIDAALILDAIGKVYGTPSPSPQIAQKPHAAPGRPRARMERKRGDMGRVLSVLADAVSMWIVSRRAK